MLFLKKASLENICQDQNSKDDIYDAGMNVLEHYKEYELYLTGDSLFEYFDNDSINIEKIKALKKRLSDYNAEIKSVHVPKSLYRTSCDTQDGDSTNYLSLDETIHDDKSFALLKKTLIFADAISDDNNAPIVVVHAGSINGCTQNNKLPEKEIKSSFFESLLNIELQHPLKIAIENVTPYTDGTNKSGQNDGWGQKFIENDVPLIIKLNKEVKNQGNNKCNISFGVCIDFCHLMVDKKIGPDQGNNLCNYIKCFVEGIKGNSNKATNDNSGTVADNDDETELKKKNVENSLIYLFHLSNLGADGSHGALFDINNDDDVAIINTIREVCGKYSNVPITLEMADGIDAVKSCNNFDKMIYTLSALHKIGKLAEMLKSKESDDDISELRCFFDDLFELYATPRTNMRKIQEQLWKVKKFVLDNSPTEDNFFEFTRDENKCNTALIRLQAYIFYTRYCNLGQYLANVYEQADFLSDKKSDFAASMKYFMFYDSKLKQCVYTGVGYSFNINFLPRKATVYRFNDGISDANVTPIKKSESYYFTEIIKKVRNQINGTTFELFSCGKNFYPCLQKYYNGSYQWSLRIYKDLPLNFVEIDNTKQSIPSFLYKDYTGKIQYGIELDFCLDVSVFRNGRDGEQTNSLNGFIKTVCTDGGLIENKGNTYGSQGSGLVYEKAGSITDGEVIATKLPEVTTGYKVSLDVALALIKACEEYSTKEIASVTIYKSADKSTKYDLTDIEIEQLNAIMEFVIQKVITPKWYVRYTGQNDYLYSCIDGSGYYQRCVNIVRKNNEGDTDE